MKRLLAGALLALLVGTQTGCNIVGPIAYFLEPPRVQKAEFKLAAGRVALVVDVARPEESNPVFLDALQEKLVEIFREQKVKAQLIPRDELVRLQQQNPDFATWDLQKVGRRLNAQQVLWVRIDRLTIREGGNSPMLQPLMQARVKVIDPAKPAAEARLWPGKDERGGRVVQRNRPAHEAGDALQVDSESAKLGKDSAYVIAQWFYDVDRERLTPWEP
jgi:hypothetical protein